ncbi:UDP-glucose 4-epimerase [Reichenbachiella faecimaris]|uniref:UDP-glucose 4-epimerase n=1 Tax=Reichenbachiella faecimaris TaxID=692418 RepID=A0A1W2GB82_REIFA|nr:UDP-glucose 4-epimerase GalE [Reichenbachiella faecimaris]SMD33861.1 UDP-glucose 4-epimerase [Reichenbachiella faecimaris]
MRKILVSGGSGYIGSHTVVELQQSGFEVLIVDDLSNSKKEILHKIETITNQLPEFVELDLKDEVAIAHLFQSYEIDAVIHFAASKSVGESVVNPLLYYHNNLLSMLNLLKAMEASDVTSFVFSSSCTVYGQPDHLPVTEQTPTKPAESPYGNTKKICEDILKDYAHANSEFNGMSLRYFNPVGAHPSGSIGERPSGVPNNLIPYLLETVAGVREKLSVFGSDYGTPDGTAIRDYIHVVDLAQAHVIAVQRQLDQKNKSNYEVFNLGSGHGYSVLEVIKAFEKVNQEKVNYELVDRRPGDIEKIYADTTYANEELGWSAKLGIEEMMRSAWQWQQNLNKES